MSRRFSPLVACAFATLVGCGTGEVSRPDAGDGDGGTVVLDDSGQPTTGSQLRFELEAHPEIPGDVGGPHKVKIDDVLFELSNVRVIGDAAPGDERTTIPSVSLTWESSDREYITYQRAPPGIYSTLIANVTRYRIRGEVDLGGGPGGGKVNFEIDDLLPGVQTFNVDLNGARLEANKPKTIKIDVELGAALIELPWDTFPMDDGDVEVEEDDPEINDIRSDILAAFTSG